MTRIVFHLADGTERVFNTPPSSPEGGSPAPERKVGRPRKYTYSTVEERAAIYRRQKREWARRRARDVREAREILGKLRNIVAPGVTK